jgi:hypothetical protein
MMSWWYAPAMVAALLYRVVVAAYPAGSRRPGE